MNYNQELFSFIQNSPSCYHAITNMELELNEAGYTKLQEADRWNLEAGGKYYVTSNTSSIIAWELPLGEYNGFHVIASHSDFPTFKLKANPEVKYKEKYTTLSVERYGGPLMAPWFDRPLSIAGRIVVEENGMPVEKLVDFGEDCVSIVNIAIHLNREVNNGHAYKMSKDMLPIWAGAGSDKSFMSELAKIAGVEEESILDTELFLYSTQEGRVWGADGEFISAPKLDDLQCAFSSMKAFLNSKSVEKVKVCAVFDNEEVGSGTRQGGKSTFLSSVLRRIADNQELGEESFGRLVANSFMLSADNGHAVHPNYAEKSDGINQVHPNGGVIIKYTASQQYTTDAVSGAYVKLLCKQAGVECQPYYNHSDVVGGSTLGNLAVAQVPMKAADIGVAQLAMHSPYETGGAEDTQSLVKVMTAFYNK